MNKPNLGQTINTLANVGVIAGIVFLAIELRQNNELLGVQIRATTMESRVRSAEMLGQNPEIVTLLGKDPSTLTDVEADQLRILGIGALVGIEHTFGEAARNLSSLEDLTRRTRTVVRRERLNYAIPLAWGIYKETADEAFAAWFEEQVLE